MTQPTGSNAISLPVAQPQSAEQEKTAAGGYFVSNYPPFSFWSADDLPSAHDRLALPPASGTELGLYVHIPFCRKRCHFCYFRVYTDKNAADIRGYLNAVAREADLYAAAPFARDRTPDFVYFGGGTPSYLSMEQLRELWSLLNQRFPLSSAREVAFEAEPGTLNEKKVHALAELGITRLSLGVENFDDHVLESNGRAHLSKQVMQAWDWVHAAGFAQVNIDLIAGMLNETDENWTRCVEQTVALAPDSVTIYQMEVPFNTTIYKGMKQRGELTAPVADWPTKRRWVGEAFAALEAAGYTVTSAYTAVRDPARTQFVYRDSLWRGADLVSLGVASFGHLGGVHVQNEAHWDPYLERLERGELPLARARVMRGEEPLIRELILQFKLGRVSSDYFRSKFGQQIARRFAPQIHGLVDRGDAAWADAPGESDLLLSREALLRVDALLPAFYLPEHGGPAHV